MRLDRHLVQLGRQKSTSYLYTPQTFYPGLVTDSNRRASLSGVSPRKPYKVGVAAESR